jgi:acyl-CoA synthetase (NDP forming)
MPHPLDAILRPKSIAVVGASRKAGAIGRVVFERLQSFGFTGPLYPVNPSASEINGVRAYATVTACPGPVDLAIIVVPHRQVETVVQDCERAKVKGLVISTSGFQEVGAEGAERERRLWELVKRAGQMGLKAYELGRAGGKRFILNYENERVVDLAMDELESAWRQGLPKLLS